MELTLDALEPNQTFTTLTLIETAKLNIKQIYDNRKKELITESDQVRQLAEIEHLVYTKGILEDVKELMAFQSELQAK